MTPHASWYAYTRPNRRCETPRCGGMHWKSQLPIPTFCLVRTGNPLPKCPLHTESDATRPVCIEQYISTGSKPARRVF